MKNQLPKSERKYRSKIIAEEHLDKYWQGVLDEYMGRRVTKFLGITYKKCYFDKTSILTAVRAEQQSLRIGRWLDMLSTSQFWKQNGITLGQRKGISSTVTIVDDEHNTRVVDFNPRRLGDVEYGSEELPCFSLTINSPVNLEIK